MTEQPLRDFLCVNCFGIAGRLVSRTIEFLYVRCDACGDISVMRDRRTRWVPGESQNRRATDPPAP
jgi:hypothetical protein